ncbi:MAG: hypothetical protein SFY81_04215 [Verrucomicrobiota bacterium]|nr:hypothetical protein [Verrucomicrobiota bacterium]
MRVTSNSFPTALINQLGDLTTRQAKLQNQAATGQRIQLPEDDPKAMRRVLDMQTEARSIDQYQRNIERQQEAATASYTVMKSLKTISDRANEIATLADGLDSPQQLAIYANEVTELIKHGIQLVNTTHRGDYLFGGTRNNTAPFVASYSDDGQVTSVVYAGNDSLPESEIGDNVKSSGHTLGENNSGSGPRGLITDSRSGADLFAHLISLQNHLRAGDTNAVANTDRAALQRDEENLIYHYGLNGATQSRLDVTLSLLKERNFSLSSEVSKEVDADLAQTLVRLNETQNAYQAALQSGGSILGMSLLDYMR